MSQKNVILNFLSKGHGLSSYRARSFGIVNPRARIAELRADGHCIYTNRSKKGTYYKMGHPSREMVRIAYAVGGESLFA
jgi:hypothetical protein